MKINLLLILLFLFTACEAQKLSNSGIDFTSNLKELTTFRETLKDVEIIALGENTFGLGQVFKAKADLVKFSHQKLVLRINP